MTNSNKRIIVLGATSAIAEATARIWAAEGARLVVVARDKGRLDAIAADLKARGATEASTVALDCSKANTNIELDAMVETLGGLDIVLLAYGTLGDQKRLEADPEAVCELIQTNFTSAVAWCLAANAPPGFWAKARSVLLSIRFLRGREAAVGRGGESDALE